MLPLRAALRVGLSAMRLSLPSTAVASSRVLTLRQFSSSAPVALAAAVRKAAAKKTVKKTAVKKAAPKKSQTKAKAKAKPKTRRAVSKTKTKAKAKPKRKVLTEEQRARRALLVVKKRKAAQLAELRALPKPPKRALSPYALFVKQMPKLEHETPKESLLRLGKAWLELPQSEKDVYAKQTVELKVARKIEYERWANEVGRSAIMKLNKIRVARGHDRLPMPESKVKAPPSSFLTFFHERSHNAQFIGLSFKERAKAVGEAWRSLPDHEREDYNERARQARAAFKASNPSA